MRADTYVRSRMMRIISSRRFQSLRQARGRFARGLRGVAPVVHYFHDVSDPFSHLAIQRLAALADRYSIPFVPHLVRPTDDPFRGDVGRFDPWARRDAASIAPGYGVEAPGSEAPIDPPAADHVVSLLAPLVDDAAEGAPARVRAFAEAAFHAGRSFWNGDSPAGTASARAEALLREGETLRTRFGHYLGGTFYFDGEWYWGIDRLYLLEQRLMREGFVRAPFEGVLVPRPEVVIPRGLELAGIELEVFPSLRSPYTAVGWPAILKLIEDTGVAVRWRPVMPMMMRGVPAPLPKQLYVISDSAREGRAAGAPIRNMVDPFGEPVRRALSLWAWVSAQDREEAFLSAYLRAAWSDGVDITTQAGLDRVLSSADLSPADAIRHFNDPVSDSLLQENLDLMLGEGLWGVPSFRVTGGGPAPFVCWGQDRIWRVAAEIVARAGGDPGIALLPSGGAA